MLRRGRCCPAGECTENLRCRWKAWWNVPLYTDTPPSFCIKMKILLLVLCVLRVTAAIIIPCCLFITVRFPVNFRSWVCATVLVVVELCKTALKKWQQTDGKINTSLFPRFLPLLWQLLLLVLRDSLLLTSVCPYPLLDRNMSKCDLLCIHSCFCEIRLWERDWLL